jgi:hypothetical protein
MITYMSEETKICSRCREPKILDEFYDTKTGKYCWCKKCALEAAKESYKRKSEVDPDFPRKRYEKYQKGKYKKHAKTFHILYVYGLSEDDCKRIIEKQNGLCPVCELPITEGKMVVDHNHDTKKVRGILHHKCNMGIGFFDDSPARLKKALSYLENDGDNLGLDADNHFFRLKRGTRRSKLKEERNI